MPTPRQQRESREQQQQPIVGSYGMNVSGSAASNQPIHITPATPQKNQNTNDTNSGSSSTSNNTSNNNNNHGKKSPGLLQQLHNLMNGTGENLDTSSTNLSSISPILKPQISPILNPAATSPLLRSISPSIPIKVPFSINDMLDEEEACGSNDTDDSGDLTYNEIQSINYPLAMKGGPYAYRSPQYMYSPPNHHIIHATPRILSPPRSPPPIIDSDNLENSCDNNISNNSNNSSASMHAPLPSFKSTSNQPFRLSGRNTSLFNRRGSPLNPVGHQRSSSLDVGSVMDHHQSFRHNHLPIHSNNSFIPNPPKNNCQMPETPNCILETPKQLKPNSNEKVPHLSPHSDYDYSTDDTSSPTSSTSSTPRSSTSSSQKKKPNLRIDTKSSGKATIPLQPIPTQSSPKVSPRNEQITPQKNIINLEQVDAYIKNNSAQKNSSTKKTFPSVFKNDFDDDDYAMLADYPVRSRSVSPPATRRSSFSIKKTPSNTSEKSDHHQTPTSTTTKDDLDSNYTTPPNRKSFSNEDGEFSSEEQFVTPPSSGDHKMESQTEVKGYRIRGFPTLHDLPSPMGSLMMKCQTPVVFKSKMHAETFSASYSHMKYYARRKKKYLMMAVEKESSIMDDEFNSLREDFIEGNNIMKRTKKLDEMSFSEMIHTERFDKNPYSSEEESETGNPNQMFFLGKRTDEKIARFLWRKMIVSIEQLHTDLKAFIHELEESAEAHEPSMSDDWHVAEMKRLAHQIIEAEVSKLIQQVYMKELNDMLSQLRGKKEESIFESLQTSFVMKELKKLIFIYSRVNRIIAVYNRIPEKHKVLSIDGRKRSSSEARGVIPRVNTPPMGLTQFSKLSFLESTLTKKSGSSSDLIREASLTDKQNLKINKLLKKWAEESTTVITPRSDQSSISTPSESVVTTDSTPQSPQDALFCRICEKSIEVSNFTAHTQTCARSHEMNMKRIGCDQKFKQLLHQIRKRRREETFGELYSYIKECYHAKTKGDLQHAIDHLKTLKEKLSVKDELKGYQSTETQTIISSIELAEEKIKTIHEYTEDFRKVSILDFTLIKPISKGAYGKVYLARKTSTPDIYAIKVIEKQYIFNHKNIAYLKNKDKILSERAVLQQLMRSNHDSKCIVNFYYSFAGKKYFFIVMEYCSGGSLDCLLEDHINKYQSAFEIDKVRKIVAEIVLALLELHAAKIVHRDLKPDNMLVDSMGRLKLTDFGLSEIGIMDREEKATSSKPRTPNPSSPPHPASFVTSPNASIESESDSDDMVQVPGTPDYIAPEILLGEEHSYAVDYWSLGCITYELLFGVPPFNADTVEDIFNNILSGCYEWPEDLPEEFQTSGVEDFVKKLLDPDPKSRLGGEIIKDHPFLKTIDWDTLLQEQLFTPVGEPEDTSRFSPRKNNYPVTPTTSGVMSPFDGATSFNSDGSSLGSPSPVRPGPFSSSLIMSPIGHSLTNFQQLSASIDFSFSSSTQALKELNIKEYNDYLRKSLNNSARSSISTGSVKRSLNFSNM